MVKIAKSRRPVMVPRSQLASSREITAASSPRGSDASRQPATAGTAPASGTGTCPVTCKNRSSARTAVTVALADSGLRSRQ